jgi:antitoxin (DNA-binding transcriptional repressor) of toxin-antitoxin stability system
MHTRTDQEVWRAPQALLDDARRGEIMPVTSDGRPVPVAVPLADGRLLQLARIGQPVACAGARAISQAAP